MTNTKDIQSLENEIASLKKELATVKYVITKMPGTVYWKDLKGRYLGYNETVAKILDIQHPEQIIGKTDSDLLGKKYAAIVTKNDQEIIQKKEVTLIEELGFDLNKQPAYYVSHKSPLCDETGEVVGILGISVDITKQKEVEKKLKHAKQKAQAANREKSRFLSTISHELRTPLTGILGMIRMLEDKNISEKEHKKYIDNIITSGNYLSSLINNLLDFNKLEKKEYPFTISTIHLNSLFLNAKEMLESTATQKGLKISLEYDPHLPEFISSDSGILMQILLNLIGNAIKFTTKGEVKIIAKLIKQKTSSADIYIAISDTGTGIPTEEIESIFKPFHQLGNIYTRDSSLTGTGLGLSIVKKFTKLLKSEIFVNSMPGQGSTFYFTTTFKIPQTKTTSRPDPTSLRSTFQIKTLLIEDDKLIQLIHLNMLEELGCQVTVVDNANCALDIVDSSFDVIFVDLGLPDINGFDLIKMIRKKHRSSIILVLTGYSDKKNIRQCIKAGANDVLIKPTSIFDLQEAIKKHLIQPI